MTPELEESEKDILSTLNGLQSANAAQLAHLRHEPLEYHGQWNGNLMQRFKNIHHHPS